jgi:galactofuranosylgalactofuranosylrhamnosyl-N-acetylglucosaminyl-diphospho-decaprenol beta-1,5/1,6-galactofuranosyltransferase
VNNEMSAGRRRVLQRVILPGEDLDVLPLYVETRLDRGASELASELLTESLGKTTVVQSADPTGGNAAVGETQSSIRFGAGLVGDLPAEAVPRRSAMISEGRRVSFATYFNAFPASYWRRWTALDSVSLRMRLAGEATLLIYRSSARGHSHPVETIPVISSEPVTIERSLPLTPFIDGGWYWFDIVAGPHGTMLIEAEWATSAASAGTGRISIGVTTFNRPDFMLEQLRTLGDAPDVLDLLDTFYVVDQGTSKVADHPDFADAAKQIGDRLVVIEQPNLGGSGGFSRGMDETVRAGRSDYHLIMDDDIRHEPESILRAATFADFARRPTIVGAHMFSMYDRAVLHAFGETVTPSTWWWGPAPNTTSRHDFGRRNLRNTPWLHRRIDSDYNGWWMCLIPTRIIGELGLALPAFIKWDDAEYALRARKAGYPTVSLPGVAAWHVPWMDKNDAQDWQAYYHLRNRLVVALLHSPVKRGGRLIVESAELHLQNLLSLRYSTAALRLLAIEDVLSGPGHLHREIGTKMADLRDLRLGFADACSEADIESFPPARFKAPDSKNIGPPYSHAGVLVKAMAGAAHQLRRPRKGAKQRPQMALPCQDASWWVLAKLDSALVSTPDGTTAAWYRRDRRLFRSLGIRGAVLHLRLRRRWPRLAAQYRAAAGAITSPDQWRQTIGAAASDEREQR